MRVQRMVVPLSLALMGLGGCNVYERWDGDEFNAGAVDAQNFPPDYLGAGANRLNSGTGSFTARRAYAGGAQTEHFLFPFSTPQRSTLAATPLTFSRLPIASAYEFEPGCKVPDGYQFDPVRDSYDSSQQGTIFSALPTASYAVGAEPTWSYVPLVARVKVTPNGVLCQTSKSEANLVTRNNKDVSLALTDPAPVTGKQVGIPEAGVYDAFAIIEPGAAVYRVGQTSANSTGVGAQKWGWFNQYLLAYIDGGQVPVSGTVLVAQKLYYPRSQVTVGTGNVSVTVGQGYDVVEARRGTAGYSPICQVLTYDAGGPLTPDQLPKTAAEIVANFGARGLNAPIRAFGSRSPVGDPYVYCLQTE